MAANFLALFILILGATGISKMLSHAEMDSYLPKSYWNQFKSYRINDVGSLGCRFKYGPYACKNEPYNPPNFGRYPDYNVNLKKYPKQSSSYVRRNWYIEEPPEAMQELWLENQATTVKSEVKQNSNENENSSASYGSSESAISSVQPDNATERPTIKFSNYFRTRPSQLSDKSINPIHSNATLSTDVNLVSDLNVTDQTVSDLKIPLESTKNTTAKPFREDTTKYKSSTFLKIFIDAINLSTFPKGSEIPSYSITPDNKIKDTKFSINSSKEHLTKSKDETFQTDSIVFQDLSSILDKEFIPLEDKSSSTKNILSTNNQDSELESTQTQSLSFSTADTGTSAKNKSNSSEESHHSTQNFETESITSQSSTILINDDTTLHSKLSSSSDIKSTTVKTSEVKSTTEYFISSSKFTSSRFTERITESDEKNFFSTKSSSSNTQVTPESIAQDHIIRISSIHTARIIITSIFLVIALIAITVLAVYIFKLKRSTVHYDQLLLLP